MPQSRRVVVLQITFLIALFLTLLFAIGSVLAENAIHPRTLSLRRDPATITVDTGSRKEDLQIQSTDGALLKAWLFLPLRPHPNYVIVIHGVGDNRGGMYRVIRMLLKNGYAVLAADSRAHGESSGALATYGVRETSDVELWADLLFRTQPVQNLYGLGESMGAAILLQSLSAEPRFRAVVAESPFSTFREVAVDRILQNFGSGAFPIRFIARQIVSAGFLYTRIRYGVDLSDASPLKAVGHTVTPILLIHGLKDTNIYPEHSRVLVLSNPRHIVPWFVPKARHTEAFSAEPEVFEERVVSFFRTYEH